MIVENVFSIFPDDGRLKTVRKRRSACHYVNIRNRKFWEPFFCSLRTPVCINVNNWQSDVLI